MRKLRSQLYHMTKLLIVANWKSNKTTEEALQWLESFKTSDLNLENKEIIICPSFTLLGVLKDKIREMGLPIKLGAQDISPFEQGAHTGDVNGRQIKEFADYVLVGHSERRSKYSESDEILLRKVEMAKRYGLDSLFFVPNETSSIPEGVKMIVYEPPSAISTSPNPIVESPQEAERAIRAIKEKYTSSQVLYGGSVDSSNAHSFLEKEDVGGVVVGHASLDPLEFLRLIQNA